MRCVNSIFFKADASSPKASIMSNKNKSKVNNRNVSDKSFFRLDPNYGPKEYDKSNKVLPNSQTSSQISSNDNEIRGETVSFICPGCNKNYKTKTGWAKHTNNCKDSQNSRQNLTLEDQNKIPPQVNNTEETIFYPWANASTVITLNAINQVYDKVVFWRKNLFLLPTGSAGKKYIEETTRLMNEWLQDSPMKDICFKAIMLMPNLLLQKPSRNSKSKDHLLALERRLELWKRGELHELFFEGETIQASLKSIKKISSISEISKKFKEQMSKGNINAALNLLTNNMENGVLPLNAQTLQQLAQKHPESKAAPSDILLQGPVPKVHPIKFQPIDEEMIRKAAIKTKGGSGPSGMDAEGWRRILASNQFGTTNCDLRKTFAEVIKKLCTEIDENNTIEAFLANRLIPLDKNPGLRPIGVGEVLRRIAGKVIVSVLKEDVMKTTGSLQVCAGQEAGIEAAIHTMNKMYDDENTEAVLLVDAKNAFNSLNRESFLHNITYLCPPLSIFVRNCYSLPSRLFMIGGMELLSKEGTTQGDPVSMIIYGIGVTPLINMLIEVLINEYKVTVNVLAYADDFSAAGRIQDLRIWWNVLNEVGPKFGYYPEPTKTWLIVKAEKSKYVNNFFKGTKVKVTAEGHRYLGGTVGTKKFKDIYVKEKIEQWLGELHMLSKIAEIEPQAAYCAFTAGFKHKITFIMRTVPSIKDHLKQLDDFIDKHFIPKLVTGHILNETERSLLSLPVKFGGLGLVIFSKIADMEFNNSRKLTEPLSKLQLQQINTYDVQNDEIKKIKNEIKKEKQNLHSTILLDIRSKLPEEKIKLNDINQEPGASTWLSTLPLKEEDYVFTKQEFWDLINIRFGWPISRLPSECSCGAKYSLQHSISCKKGGFVTIRHNNIRNLTAQLLTHVCNDVRIEPPLQALTGEAYGNRTANTSDEARLDISARGFWTKYQMAFFDVRVFDPNAKRYEKKSLTQSYLLNEKEKKRQYNERVMQVENGSFTPLVFTVNGSMGREASKFYKRLAEVLCEKRNEPYSLTMSWIRRKISFSLMRSVIMCLRGSRSIKPEYVENRTNELASYSETRSDIH